MVAAETILSEWDGSRSCEVEDEVFGGVVEPFYSKCIACFRELSNVLRRLFGCMESVDPIRLRTSMLPCTTTKLSRMSGKADAG
jgi:hypothetical protein